MTTLTTFLSIFKPRTDQRNLVLTTSTRPWFHFPQCLTFSPASGLLFTEVPGQRALRSFIQLCVVARRIEERKLYLLLDQIKLCYRMQDPNFFINKLTVYIIKFYLGN